LLDGSGEVRFEGEAERLRHALKRMSREVERREQERAAGLLSERWTRELSNH
jgi:hypothetical protein